MSNGGPSQANIQTATVNHVTVQLSQSDLQTIGEAAGSGAGKAISQAFQELKQSITSVGGAIQSGFAGVNIEVRSLGGAVGQVNRDIQNMQLQLLAQLSLEMKAIQAVEQEVNRSIKAGVQAQISKFLGDLEGLKTAVRLALLQVAEIFGKSVKRQRAIFDKYSQMEAEVMRAFERDIRKLGEPIYRFIENEYFPLLELSKGFIEDTRNSFKKSTYDHLARRERLDDLPQEKLQQARSDFIRNTQGRAHSRSQAGVGLNLSDGLIQLECLYCAPSDPAVPGKYISTIHSSEGAGSAISLSEVTSSEHSDFRWRSCTQEEKTEVVDALVRLQERGLISESHADFLCFSVKAHGFETRIEGTD